MEVNISMKIGFSEKINTQLLNKTEILEMKNENLSMWNRKLHNRMEQEENRKAGLEYKVDELEHSTYWQR